MVNTTAGGEVDVQQQPSEERNSFASLLLTPFVKFVNCLNFGHAVHPSAPIAPPDSEFVQADGYALRVLHLVPGATTEKRLSARNSLTEEYWFTRWNKPLRAGDRCSCSFRRSKLLAVSETPSVPSVPTTRITNLETFVERLIQETLMEALQEYYVAKTKQTAGGYDNLAYVRSGDEVDAAVGVVVKRRQNKSKNGHGLCHHKTKKDKPFVFLLHAIGSGADAWWHVVRSLTHRGYEVVAPDMLGHGYSAAPDVSRAYKFKRLLRQTLAIFDHYASADDGRKFVVIGHSFGCSLAAAVARYRAQQVVQLVLISGGGPTALSPPTIGNEISVFSNLQLLISPLLFCGIKRSLFYATRGKHFARCNDVDDSIPKYVYDYIDRGQHWPEGDAAFHRRILIPTLLVHGLKDTTVTLVQECEMERTIPRAFLELIPTAGHMSLLETPEQLSHMILCFLDWWAR